MTYFATSCKWNYFFLHFSFSLAKTCPTFSSQKSKKKLHHLYNQLIYIYFYDSFLVFSISLSPPYFFFHSSQVIWSVLYRFPSPKSLLTLAPIPKEWPLLWLKSKKSYTSKTKTYIKSNFHKSDFFHFFCYFLAPKTVKSPLTSSHVSCSIFFFLSPLFTCESTER